MNENTNLRNKTLDIVVLISIGLLALAIIIFFVFSFTNDRDRVDEIKNTIVEVNPFDSEISEILEAKAAIVWDLNANRPIFEYNPSESLPLASLTKLVTAAVALETVPAYTAVEIDENSISQEGDSGFHISEKWSVGELIKTVLVSSSNDGARAIAGAAGTILVNESVTLDDNEKYYEAFISEMNRFAIENGLTNSRFFNEHGLDISTDKNGGYGSAKDVALLMDYLYTNYPEALEATTLSEVRAVSVDGNTYLAKNTNLAINQIAGVLASKTGFTDIAGGNVAVIINPGMEGPFVIVVLGSSFDGRFSDLAKLSKATLEYVIKNR